MYRNKQIFESKIAKIFSIHILYIKVSSSANFAYGLEVGVKQSFSNQPHHQMGKSVLYGPVTFGRNHSYPSTSITKKVEKMEKFPPSTKSQLHLKTVLFFFGTTTFLNVNCLGELTLKVYYMAKKLFKHVEIS